MQTNLPIQTQTSSDSAVKQIFDKFYQNQVTFPAEQIDAVVGFFTKKGFDPSSARSTAIVLLNQAKSENVNVMTVVDTLKGLDDIALSQVVAQILNSYREKTSLLGYRIAPVSNLYESRNILV